MRGIISSVILSARMQPPGDSTVINYVIAVVVVAALVYIAILQFWVLLRTRRHLAEMKDAYK